MASFGAMTLYTGGVNRAEAAVDVVIGQVLAYDQTQKATLADATDQDLARPIGVSLTNTEAGGLCVFATSPAIFDSGNLTSQDQDDRFYVSHVPVKFASLMTCLMRLGFPLLQYQTLHRTGSSWFCKTQIEKITVFSFFSRCSNTGCWSYC